MERQGDRPRLHFLINDATLVRLPWVRRSVEQRASVRKKVSRRVVDTTMDAVTMLRDLWHHRHAVAGVIALSALAGISMVYSFSLPAHLESRRYDVGVATTGVLIDTPSSQV